MNTRGRIDEFFDGPGHRDGLVKQHERAKKPMSTRNSNAAAARAMSSLTRRSENRRSRKALGSQPWPEDADERHARAAQLNRHALVMNGVPEDEVAAMSNMEVAGRLKSTMDRSESSTLTWKDAAKMIPYNSPAKGAVMNQFVNSNGMSIFATDGKNYWANAKKNPYARLGWDLAAAFHAENGGGVMWRDVAMFALAAEADGVNTLPRRVVDLITAGFEEGSAEAKKQSKTQKPYPNITAVIQSFF